MMEAGRADPVFEGKRVSEWTAIARDEAANPSRRSHALHVLTRFKPKGLIRILVELLRSADLEVRLSAARAFAVAPEVPKWVVPVLVRSLDRSGPRERFGWPNPHDPDELTLSDIIGYAVGRAGPAERSSVPALVACLKVENPAVRELAAYVLGKMGAEAIEAVPSLQVAVADTDPQVRAMASLGAWRIMGDARSALPVVVEALGSGFPDPPLGVVWMLEEMAGAAPVAMEAIEGATRSGDERIRLAAALALWRATGRTETSAQRSAPVLVALLKSADWQVRLMAAEDLAAVGRGVPSALAALEEIVRTDESDVVRKEAERAIEQITGPDMTQNGRGPVEGD